MISTLTLLYATARRTLRACRALRPHARWGLYGYPQAGLYDVGNASSLLVRYSRTQLPIFQESDALFPSLYLVRCEHPVPLATGRRAPLH
jgi:hypothetical protein